MKAQEAFASYARKEKQARRSPGQPARIGPGLYLVFAGGRVHEIEHVFRSDGFARTEWTISTGDDLHHDQYQTMRAALESLTEAK